MQIFHWAPPSSVFTIIEKRPQTQIEKQDTTVFKNYNSGRSKELGATTYHFLNTSELHTLFHT